MRIQSLFYNVVDAVTMWVVIDNAAGFSVRIPFAWPRILTALLVLSQRQGRKLGDVWHQGHLSSLMAMTGTAFVFTHS